MTDKVVDASALAAILFAELRMGEAQVALADAALFAPQLIRHEIANVGAKKLRANPTLRDQVLSAMDDFAEYRIREVEIDLGQVVELADRERLSAYDASYLWLAQSMGIELVTLDNKLARAAARG